MFVRFVHEYEFCTGDSVPASQVNLVVDQHFLASKKLKSTYGPFSVNRPLSEEHPGPPLNQRATSSVAFGFVEGKNLS
jgi:hypothetical protein